MNEIRESKTQEVMIKVTVPKKLKDNWGIAYRYDCVVGLGENSVLNSCFEKMPDNRMISLETKEKLRKMGYVPNDDGSISVADDQGQQYFKIIYEDGDTLVLYGGINHYAFTAKLDEFEWRREADMGPGTDYNGLRPLIKNGNWPTVHPE